MTCNSGFLASVEQMNSRKGKKSSTTRTRTVDIFWRPPPTKGLEPNSSRVVAELYMNLCVDGSTEIVEEYKIFLSALYAATGRLAKGTGLPRSLRRDEAFFLFNPKVSMTRR